MDASNDMIVRCIAYDSLIYVVERDGMPETLCNVREGVMDRGEAVGIGLGDTEAWAILLSEGVTVPDGPYHLSRRCDRLIVGQHPSPPVADINLVEAIARRREELWIAAFGKDS